MPAGHFVNFSTAQNNGTKLPFLMRIYYINGAHK